MQLAPGKLRCSEHVAEVAAESLEALAQAVRKVPCDGASVLTGAVVCKVPPGKGNVVRSRQCANSSVTPRGCVAQDWLVSTSKEPNDENCQRTV